MPLRGVIFDLDGTLVDSEPLARRAWTETLAPHGHVPGESDWRAVTGTTFLATHRHFAGLAPLPDAETVYADFTQRLYVLFDAGLAPFPDALAVAGALREEGVPTAVASSSRADRVARALALTGMADLFDVVVGGDEVARGKPAPDIFLLAADKLGVASAGCVVVEDSGPGVLAGLAAGMGVVAVRREGAELDGLARATLVTSELTLDALAAARP